MEKEGRGMQNCEQGKENQEWGIMYQERREDNGEGKRKNGKYKMTTEEWSMQ